MTTQPFSCYVKAPNIDKRRFNIMVVGESGMGKTTFLQALLRKYVDECRLQKPNDSIKEPTTSIDKIGSFEVLNEADDSLDITLYDSPGYGDFINNQEPINRVKDYILKAHQQWRALDAQSMTEAEFLQADNRIHCVFYFLASHRMKDIDREFITQLSPIVSIIPIIGKADTMTVKERNSYIQTVKTKLDEISNKIGEKCIYDFDGDDLLIDNNNDSTWKEAERFQRVPNIFACICDVSKERVYSYGSIDTENHEFSDLTRIQTATFENDRHLKGMMDQTRNKTIKLFRKPPRPASPRAGSSILVVSPRTMNNNSNKLNIIDCTLKTKHINSCDTTSSTHIMTVLPPASSSSLITPLPKPPLPSSLFKSASSNSGAPVNVSACIDDEEPLMTIVQDDEGQPETVESSTTTTLLVVPSSCTSAMDSTVVNDADVNSSLDTNDCDDKSADCIITTSVVVVSEEHEANKDVGAVVEKVPTPVKDDDDDDDEGDNDEDNGDDDTLTATNARVPPPPAPTPLRIPPPPAAAVDKNSSDISASLILAGSVVVTLGFLNRLISPRVNNRSSNSNISNNYEENNVLDSTVDALETSDMSSAESNNTVVVADDDVLQTVAGDNDKMEVITVEAEEPDVANHKTIESIDITPSVNTPSSPTAETTATTTTAVSSSRILITTPSSKPPRPSYSFKSVGSHSINNDSDKTLSCTANDAITTVDVEMEKPLKVAQEVESSTSEPLIFHSVNASGIDKETVDDANVVCKDTTNDSHQAVDCEEIVDNKDVAIEVEESASTPSEDEDDNNDDDERDNAEVARVPPPPAPTPIRIPPPPAAAVDKTSSDISASTKLRLTGSVVATLGFFGRLITPRGGNNNNSSSENEKKNVLSTTTFDCSIDDSFSQKTSSHTSKTKSTNSSDDDGEITSASSKSNSNTHSHDYYSSSPSSSRSVEDLTTLHTVAPLIRRHSVSERGDRMASLQAEKLKAYETKRLSNKKQATSSTTTDTVSNNNDTSEPASYKSRNQSQSVHNEGIGSGSGSYSSRSLHHRSTPLEEVRNRSASLSPRAVMTGRANNNTNSYATTTTARETNTLTTRHRSESQSSLNSKSGPANVSPRPYHASASASSRRDTHTKPTSSSSVSVSSRSHRHCSDAGSERGTGGSSHSSRKDGGVTSFLNATFHESTAASSSSNKSTRGGGSSSVSVTSEKDSRRSPRNTRSGSVSSTSSSKNSHALY